MYCPNCGMENEVGDRFCTKCGHALPEASALREEPAAPQPEQAPQAPPQQAKTGPAAKETDVTGYRPDKKIQKVSKAFFFGSVVAGLGAGTVLLILGAFVSIFSGVSASSAGLQIASVFSVLGYGAITYALIVWFILIYKMWVSLPEDAARTSPGKAVGLLFVPFYNFYWIFQATWGFSQDYNKFVSQQRPEGPRLPEGLFLAFSILGILNAIPLIGTFTAVASAVILPILVFMVCDAINYLATAEEGVQAVPGGDVKAA